MPKNKRHKYERVKNLPNVTLSESQTASSPDAYPWYSPRYAGMPTVLELGCGKGEHTLDWAARNPERLYVGVDYKSHRMCVGAERAMAGKLANVHFLRARVEHIRDFFQIHSIQAIWLTFPDPHLKNRRTKFRLTAAPFLDAYSNLLVSSGSVHLKTDSAPFCRFTRESVRRWGGQELSYSADLYGGASAPSEGSITQSAYEEAALARGAAIHYLVFTL